MANETPESILDLTAHEQGVHLRSGAVTARALAEAALARVRAQEPSLNAYISVNDTEALAQADAADARLRAGHAAPLTGIPIGEMMREGWMFLVMLMVLLLAMTLFPQIVLWLPHAMGYVTH